MGNKIIRREVTGVEFNEKLQELRKARGLTQQELADRLYVSRTAVSKWESGRGIPSIDSLRSIARFYSISLDELMSGEELLTIAEEDRRGSVGAVRDLVFGLSDCAMALLLFLPFFGQRTADGISAVSLISLTGVAVYMRVAYIALVGMMVALGILTLALQNCRAALWVKTKHPLSAVLSAVGVCLFTLGGQPYAAIFTFIFTVIKAILLLKRP